jgi:hypothetical protein
LLPVAFANGSITPEKIIAYRGSDLTSGTTKRPFLPIMALCACLALAGCGSFSGFVADTWPTWAGGMPKDVPPRPGAPGYEDFIAHQQRQDTPANAGAAPGTTSAVSIPGAGPSPTPSTTPPSTAAVAVPVASPAATAATPPAAASPRTVPLAGNSRAQQQQPLPPAYSPDDRSATQGGLY